DRVALLVGALVLSACAPSATAGDAAATAAQAVLGGTPDSDDDAVVFVATVVDAAQPELCTGTLVASRVVLTAGNCTLGRDPSDHVVGFGAFVKLPTQTVAIAEVHTYPGFHGDPSDLDEGTDLGILVLAADAPVAPLTLGELPAGTRLRVVGYG